MIKNRLRKRFPDFVAHWLAGKLASHGFKLTPESIIAFLPSRETDDCHRGREVAISRQIVKCRNQFAIREIAGGAKDYNGARLRDRPCGQTFA